MALPLRPVVVVFLFALAQANTELSDCNVLKGKVSCLDCRGRKNTSLSGIQVLVKCDKVKKLWTATTKDSGFFEIEIPPARTTIPSSNCLAKVLGGPRQLYATRNAMVSKIVEARDGSGRPYFTTSTPLAVSTTCPRGKASITCGKNTRFGSSMTVDLPIPREWGFPPTSYYSPVIPIIGIP